MTTRALPAGTVTFLFTDIEGSTRLMHELGDAYALAHDDHNRILREAFARHGGIELRTEGDSFFAVFERADAALTAAVDAQRSLAGHPWPGTPVRVRMGLHTGDAPLVGGEYVGIAVHQAARVAEAANGGQILLTGVTADLASAAMPAGASLVDLGVHRLKDLAAGIRLLRVGHDALTDNRPPRTLNALPHNLPVQLTTFIGRQEELARVHALLEHERLVTITGAGGSGKTRLALQAVADELHRFPDGVWLIDLAQLTDPDLIIQAVAGAIAIPEVQGEDTTTTVERRLSAARALLLFDNCEHLVEPAAGLVTRLLKSCADLVVLVTSREPLGIPGELTWRIPSLPVPERVVSVDDAASVDAVALFATRAAAVRGDGFELTAENIGPVLDICRRLDGIPLAIELAAARTTTLSPQQISERMDDRFRLLTGSARTSLGRQRTLRAVVDWSHSLLVDDERVLFRRLAVFAGSFTLDAAEQVCEYDPLPEGSVLDLIGSLLDKSLLVAEEGDQMRYRLLETLRQYAQDKLVESEEADEARVRHLGWVEELARACDQTWGTRREQPASSAVVTEYENVRSAISFALAHRSPEVAERGLQVVAWLGRFWRDRLSRTEGQRWVARALDATSARTRARARALRFAATFANNMVTLDELLDQAEEIARETEDLEELGTVLMLRAIRTRDDGDLDGAARLLDEARTVCTTAGDETGLAFERLSRGRLAERLGRRSSAIGFYRESVELAQRCDAVEVEGLAEEFLAGIAQAANDVDAEHRHLERALVLSEELGRGAGRLHAALGWTAFAQGDFPMARSYFTQAAEGLDQIAGVTDDPLDPPEDDQLIARYFGERFVDRFRRLGSEALEIQMRFILALHDYGAGNITEALEELLAVESKIHAWRSVNASIQIRSWIALLELDAGMPEAACDRIEENIAAVVAHDPIVTLNDGGGLADACFAAGRIERGFEGVAMGLEAAATIDLDLAGAALIPLFYVAANAIGRRGDRDRAARVLGAADAMDRRRTRRAFGQAIDRYYAGVRARTVAAADLDADDLADARAAGEALTPEEALVIARG